MLATVHPLFYTPGVPPLRHRIQARLAAASVAVDDLFRLFVELRSELMVAATPPEQWSQVTARVYGRRSRYRDPAFNLELLPWEAEAVQRHFPAPPARILVGAAGGGRELYALAQRGYQVAGFEPAAELVQAARRHLGSSVLQLERGSYEDLIAGGRCSVQRHAPYDAVVLGWSSFSNLGSVAIRVDLLQTTRRLCPHGPVLLSWWQTVPAGGRREGLRRLLAVLGSHRSAPHDSFTTHAGFIHGYTTGELRDLAAAAGYSVAWITDTASYPHAVLKPAVP